MRSKIYGAIGIVMFHIQLRIMKAGGLVVRHRNHNFSVPDAQSDVVEIFLRFRSKYLYTEF
jgi:hypothetical protein